MFCVEEYRWKVVVSRRKLGRARPASRRSSRTRSVYDGGTFFGPTGIAERRRGGKKIINTCLSRAYHVGLNMYTRQPTDDYTSTNRPSLSDKRNPVVLLTSCKWRPYSSTTSPSRLNRSAQHEAVALCCGPLVGGLSLGWPHLSAGRFPRGPHPPAPS